MTFEKFILTEDKESQRKQSLKILERGKYKSPEDGLDFLLMISNQYESDQFARQLSHLPILAKFLVEIKDEKILQEYYDKYMAVNKLKHNKIINKVTSFSEFKQKIDEEYTPTKNTVSKKESSNLVYEDENIKVFYARNPNDSISLGKDSSLCISDPHHNLFSMYRLQGMSTYFIFFKDKQRKFFIIDVNHRESESYNYNPTFDINGNHSNRDYNDVTKEQIIKEYPEVKPAFEKGVFKIVELTEKEISKLRSGGRIMFDELQTYEEMEDFIDAGGIISGNLTNKNIHIDIIKKYVEMHRFHTKDYILQNYSNVDIYHFFTMDFINHCITDDKKLKILLTRLFDNVPFAFFIHRHNNEKIFDIVFNYVVSKYIDIKNYKEVLMLIEWFTGDYYYVIKFLKRKIPDLFFTPSVLEARDSGIPEIAIKDSVFIWVEDNIRQILYNNNILYSIPESIDNIIYMYWDYEKNEMMDNGEVFSLNNGPDIQLELKTITVENIWKKQYEYYKASNGKIYGTNGDRIRMFRITGDNIVIIGKNTNHTNIEYKLNTEDITSKFEVTNYLSGDFEDMKLYGRIYVIYDRFPNYKDFEIPIDLDSYNVENIFQHITKSAYKYYEEIKPVLSTKTIEHINKMNEYAEYSKEKEYVIKKIDERIEEYSQKYKKLIEEILFKLSVVKKHKKQISKEEFTNDPISAYIKNKSGNNYI